MKKSYFIFSITIFIFAMLMTGCKKEEIITVDDVLVSEQSPQYTTGNKSATSGTYTYWWAQACGGPVSASCGTFNGGLNATLISDGGNQFRVRIRKSDGTAFVQSGTARVYAVQICGTVCNSKTYAAGVYYVDVPILATMATGVTVNFYGATIPAAGGYRSNSASVTIKRN